ncbi:MAG: PorV/PorQ family protein [bacterium]|nr:PorV/PorQ family protein [bacterium]
MKKSLFFYLILALMLLNSSKVFALLLKKEDIGTKAASFLKLNPSPKILSLGGYNISLSSNIEAINSNPAGLVISEDEEQRIEINKQEAELRRQYLKEEILVGRLAISSSYHFYLEDISYGHLSFYKRINNSFALALSIANIDTGEMLVTTKEDIYGNKNSKFHPNFQMLNISYGRYLIKNRLTLGLNTKILRAHIKKNKKFNFSLDIGTIYIPYDFLNLSFLIKDLGIKLNKESLPTEVVLGSGLKLLQNTFLVNLDLILPSDDKLTLATGVEYSFLDTLFARIGYRSNIDKELQCSHFSLGIGLKVRGFILDYAFLPYGDLGDSHRVAISWKE